MKTFNNSTTDDILIESAKSGDSESLNALILRYSDKILLKASSFKNLYGIDNDDLYQEGMMGFIAAVYSFDCTKNTKFSTYSMTVAVRRMLSALRKSKDKEPLLGAYISLEKDSDLLSYSPTPEEIVLFNEKIDNIVNFVEENFSKTEKKVFKLNMLGLTYAEIAEILECSEKSVDNALQRIRKKIRNIK